MSTMGERIRAEREAQEISREDLARAAGLAVSTLSDLELGLSKSTTKLHRIAQRLGLRATYLETGRGPREASADDDQWADIQGSTQGAALGDGSAPDEYAEAHQLKFRRYSLQKKGLHADKLRVYYGTGSSMEPRIHAGDAILVNTAESAPAHGRIFMVRWEGHYYAKRLKQLGGMWFLCSDNGDDPKWRDPVPVQASDDFEIIGAVRWIGSWED